MGCAVECASTGGEADQDATTGAPSTAMYLGTKRFHISSPIPIRKIAMATTSALRSRTVRPPVECVALMDGELRAASAAIATELGLECDLRQVDQFPASRFDSDCIDAVRRAARSLGYPHRDIVSGAGHDAIYIARVAPTAMIFVPCKDGISHNEIEDARPEHLEAGANVLLHAMLARATGVGRA